MHANAALLTRLFTALAAHDPDAMASCYHREARFRDIAFDRRGRDEIHDMWRMICAGDIAVKFEIVDADDHSGLVRLVDDYTIGGAKDPPEDRRPVRNEIESRFQFRGDRIWRQDDDCDAKQWARQALGGGPIGFLAGRIRLVRSVLARAKLAAFLAANRKRTGKQVH